MEWAMRFGADRQPAVQEISEYIASPLWREMNDFLRESYAVEPSYSYSVCSGQPGWNVKYQKGGRALCTLYPMPGFFIALVVIGTKEQPEAELLLPTCSEYVQGLYAGVPAVMGGRWLMIHVTEPRILSDVKQLIQLRRPIKPKIK